MPVIFHFHINRIFNHCGRTTGSVIVISCGVPGNANVRPGKQVLCPGSGTKNGKLAESRLNLEPMKLWTTSYGRLNRLINNRLLQHVAYWLVFVSFFSIVWGSYDFDFEKTFSIQLILLPLHAALVYFVIYFLIPHYLFRRKVALFFLLYWLTLFVAAVLNRCIDNYVILARYLPHWYSMSLFHPVVLLSTIIKLNFPLALPVTIKVFNYLAQVQRSQQELERKKIEAELSFLKAQIHPHFLFNTLNSIYALVLKKSDVAKEVVLKFSHLLRYVLYDTNQEKVALQQEVDFIKDYLSLEKLRFEQWLNVNVQAKGNMRETKIAPMLITPFVENAVKHCGGRPDAMAHIEINMEVKTGIFTLQVRNTVGNGTDSETVGGVGLLNVKKRLDLLYPKAYQLNIKESHAWYEVYLSIKL